MSAEKGLEAFAKSSLAISEATIPQLAAATQLMKTHPHSQSNLRMKQDLESNFTKLAPHLEKYLELGDGEIEIASYEESDTDINSSEFDTDIEDDSDILSSSSKLIREAADKKVKENAHNF